jgi:hypothetical protein
LLFLDCFLRISFGDAAIFTSPGHLIRAQALFIQDLFGSGGRLAGGIGRLFGCLRLFSRGFLFLLAIG